MLVCSRSLMIRLWCLLGFVVAVLAADETLEESKERLLSEEVEEREPADAVLFPWFVLAITVFIYYLLSRYAKWIPYTGMCFLLGTIMGIAAQRRDNADNLLNASMREWWINIDGEVLLLIFLPGLVYKDASSLNVHLFQVAFGQCLMFAFPMVLAGTTLTALVCFYIFPYNWSFDLSMTAGSILSATDPVAVSALLTELAAPQRLQVHVAGESLLNDGSAIVFFTIFGMQRFLNELGVEGLGEPVDWALGVKMFFRMSLGAVGIGIMFAMGTLSVFNMLNRRLNREENVVEVAFEMTMAYLCFFVAEVAWRTSGVIATVTLGVLINAFSHAVTNDKKLADDFTSLVEHMLNTVLFALGGLVWGMVIANDDEENPERQFTARDWGYLILLYLFLTVIRFFLFTSFYPINSRIGLKSCVPEMIFQSFAGLRGAVGIALAISLDNTVRRADADDSKYELQTNKLFGFVGGIAFMTLMINATTAGPLLRRLGLVDTTTIREKMLTAFRQKWRTSQLEDMVRLLAQQRCYSRVNFAVVAHHIPDLADLTTCELLDAVELYKQAHAHEAYYREPNVHRMLADLMTSGEEKDDLEEFSEEASQLTETQHDGSDISYRLVERNAVSLSVNKLLTKRRRMSVRSLAISKFSLIELRLLFLELVRAAYDHQQQNGELTEREVVSFYMFQSLDLAVDRVQKGEPICDWELSAILEKPLLLKFLSLRPVQWLVKLFDWVRFGQSTHAGVDYLETRLTVERALAFVHAHQTAQEQFRTQFAMHAEFSRQAELVLDESIEEVAQAEAVLLGHDREDLEVVVSHKFCSIILLNAAKKIEQLSESGLLQPTEAEEFLEEVQTAWQQVNSCDMRHHEGEAHPYEPFTPQETTQDGGNGKSEVAGG